MKTSYDLSRASALVALSLWTASWGYALRHFGTNQWLIIAPSALILAYACFFLTGMISALLRPRCALSSLYVHERGVMLPMLACRCFVEVCASKAPLHWIVLSPFGLAVELALLILVIPWYIGWFFLLAAGTLLAGV